MKTQKEIVERILRSVALELDIEYKENYNEKESETIRTIIKMALEEGKAEAIKEVLEIIDEYYWEESEMGKYAVNFNPNELKKRIQALSKGEQK